MRIRQVAQHVEDRDRAVALYERLLGRPAAARFDPPGLAFFVLGDTRLLLEAGAASATIYFEVPDVSSTLTSLRAQGVEVTGEPHVIFHHGEDAIGSAGTDEWMAFVRDSEGNTVGLVSTRTP